MLASGAGIVVEHRNAHALAVAIRTVISDPTVAADMASEARRIAPSLGWDTVSQRYVDLAREMLRKVDVVSA